MCLYFYLLPISQNIDKTQLIHSDQCDRISYPAIPKFVSFQLTIKYKKKFVTGSPDKSKENVDTVLLLWMALHSQQF